MTLFANQTVDDLVTFSGVAFISKSLAHTPSSSYLLDPSSSWLTSNSSHSGRVHIYLPLHLDILVPATRRRYYVRFQGSEQVGRLHTPTRV